MKRSRSPMIVTITVILFFYIPLVILALNSFNDTRFGGPWKGFTLKWYSMLFHEPKVWYALGNSILIAATATTVSMTWKLTSGCAAADRLTAWANMKPSVRMSLVPAATRPSISAI